MLSKLSLTIYSEFLRENLHKINNGDLLVIKTISDMPETETMCVHTMCVPGFSLSFFELNSMEILREKSQLPIPSFF